MTKKIRKIVPDTSVVIDGRITELLRDEKGDIEVIIPEAVVAELESQANLGRETGFDGLNELKAVRKLAQESEGRIVMGFYGRPPRDMDIKLSREGAIDDLIRECAHENDAVLITSDKTQAIVSEAKGIEVSYIGPRVKVIKPRVFDFFDPKTASIHIKEDTPVYAKKGHVADFRLVEIRPPMGREEIEGYAKELIGLASSDPRGYIETEKRGVTVIQLREYRIVIARPPFSDGLEITAVRPLAKTSLEDYGLSEKLMTRLSERAEGVFIAGAPGQGKSTFAQALAELYLSHGKIVKTMENPRDLQVPDEVTQYTRLEGSMEQTGDILLLVRPDYTIYDELRKTNDFTVFADMRLAGVGMVGVTHANKPIDAVQRLVGRVELGIIPHIVDTIVYIKAGKINKVYELSMTVKVPHGMRDADLSRPVVEVRDFETGLPEYELYSFGEEVVVIPVRSRGRRETGRSVRPRGSEADVEISGTKKLLILRTDIKDEVVSVCADGRELFTSRVNRAGNLKIKRSSSAGKMLSEAVHDGKKITLR